MPEHAQLSAALPHAVDQELFLDCVVAGSGFGGSVMAARLAPHFKRGQLALLERGREFLPGDFPARTLDGLRQIKSPVNPLGLFDFHLQPDLDILCANALGGGSNIYANVALEPDDAAFLARHNARPEAPAWPAGTDKASLQPYFERVRAMLAVEKYLDQSDCAGGPDQAEATQSVATDYCGRTAAQRAPLPKAELLRQLAASASPLPDHTLHYAKVPLAVNFTRVANGSANAFGVVQQQCNLCGDCVTGCNRNAKNTLCCNYLPLARQGGCAIYSQTELLGFGPAEHAGYRYTLRVQQRLENNQVQQRTIHTRMLVLSAGVLGSTRLLLQCQRKHGLRFSAQLGENISGNLDMVAFSYNAQADLHASGQGAQAQPTWEVGPTICAALEFRQQGQRKFQVQDGAWPSVLVRPLAVLLATGQFLRPLPWPKRWRGAMQRSMVWLGIGRDQASGQLRLRRDGSLQLRWTTSSDAGFARIHQALAAFSERMGARYVKNPRERLSWLGSKASTPITVHPLGGCCMGQDASLGVTDSVGRVFNGQGRSVHPGLYVADGALCCSALGANPSLTIAALAERAAERIAADDLAACIPN